MEYSIIMLALFKESAVNIMNEEMGVIVPFHRFYDALENFLDHSHSGVIIRAYDNSYINPEKKDRDVFAINVLKTLFMIKYVLEIESNIDNITSLMIENIDDDRIELKGRVEEALKILMRQMLVQKNGSIYVFLPPQGWIVGPPLPSAPVQFNARAIRRAVVVLPYHLIISFFYKKVYSFLILTSYFVTFCRFLKY